MMFLAICGAAAHGTVLHCLTTQHRLQFGLNGARRFLPENVGDALADDVVGRETEKFGIPPVGKTATQLTVTMKNEGGDVLGDLCELTFLGGQRLAEAADLLHAVVVAVHDVGGEQAGEQQHHRNGKGGHEGV